MKCCILHQKLQMLNCSILHKIKHQPQQQQQQQQEEEGSTHNHLNPPTNTSPSPASRTHRQSLELQHTPSSTTASGERGGEREGEGTYPQQEREVPTRPISDSSSRLLPREEEKEGGRSSNDDESDDEFFEALEDHEEEEDVGDPTLPPLQREPGDRKEEEEEREGRREREGEVEREERQGTEDKPDGRLQLCGDLVLIATGEPMYIPVTQVSIKPRLVPRPSLASTRKWV